MRKRQGKPLEQRFWALVEFGGDCWTWLGYTLPKDGRALFSGRSAARIAYRLLRGDVSEDLLVCHHCDNPKCVNPSHMFLGSQADNMRDCAKKGRIAAAKISPNDVEDMRWLAGLGVSAAKLSSEYGVTKALVSRALSGERWGHI